MMRPAVRLVAVATLPVLALLGGRVSAHAASHRAALVIEHSNGSLIARCVAFAEEAISGLQLIERSGIEVRTQSFGDFGAAVCQLDLEPAQVPSNCFGTGPYWQYYRHDAAGWRLSATGASGSAVHDGDLNGWHYAAGPQPPRPDSFARVCGAPAPAPGHVTAAPVSTPPARAGPAPSTTAPPAAAEASDPVPVRAPARTLVVLPDSGLGRSRPASPAGAAPAMFAASLALLGLLLLLNLRRRLS